MTWNVYRHDINSKEIKTYNVFDHYTFNQDVQKILKKKITYEELSDELKSSAMYCFWSKCEYEVVITSFPPYIDKEELNKLVDECEQHPYRTYVNLETGIKIDIYGQLKMNWEHFVDYVWGFAKRTKD